MIWVEGKLHGEKQCLQQAMKCQMNGLPSEKRIPVHPSYGSGTRKERYFTDKLTRFEKSCNSHGKMAAQQVQPSVTVRPYANK